MEETMPWSRVLALALPLSLLVGCKPTLEGAWSGSWDCSSSLQMDVEVEFERLDRVSYAGRAVQNWSSQWVTDGQEWSASLELRSAWELITDKPHGDQDIELTVMLTGADCERSVEGQVETTDCIDLGIDTEAVDPHQATQAWWDGADAIGADIDFCSVGLARVGEG